MKYHIEKQNISKRIALSLFLCLLSLVLSADDKQANEEFRAATKAARAKKYAKAADLYLAAELYAEDPVLKANALKAAAKNFKKAKLRFKEYECLEKLINAFPNYIKFEEVVDREFVIGDSYFSGYRDPAFTWFPWIKGDDKTMEIYKTALKHGPFAKGAAQARLRLGRLYIEKNDEKKAIETLRDVIKMYPDTEEQKYAMFELASVLVQLSKSGDGDGKYTSEAEDMLKKIIKKYPDDPETPWAKEAAEKVHGYSAKRLYGLAKFYHRKGNDEAAERYLNQVVKEYHDTEVTYDSEELLAEIDKDFNVTAKDNWKAKDAVPYKMTEIPDEPEKILVTPENSDGKWLLPIMDLNINKQEDKERDVEESENIAIEILDKEEPKVK